MAAKKTNRPRATFSLIAPEAQSVKLAADFTHWEQEARELRRLKNGTWKTTVPVEPGAHQYRFIVDGQWVDDPGCPQRIPNPYGGENCILRVE